MENWYLIMVHAIKILLQSDHVTAEHVQLRDTHDTLDTPTPHPLQHWGKFECVILESAFRVSTSCHGPWVSLLKYLVNSFSLVIPISLFASCPIPLSIALIRPLSHYPYPMWKSTILFLGVKRWKSKSISSHHQIFIFYFL